MSRSLKYDSNFFSRPQTLYIYIYMDTTVDHFTLLALRVWGKNALVIYPSSVPQINMLQVLLMVEVDSVYSGKWYHTMSVLYTLILVMVLLAINKVASQFIQVVNQLIGRAKRAPHWGVQSRFRILSVCRMSVVCQINCVGGITWPTRMLKVFFGRLNQ